MNRSRNSVVKTPSVKGRRKLLKRGRDSDESSTSSEDSSDKSFEEPKTQRRKTHLGLSFYFRNGHNYQSYLTNKDYYLRKYEEALEDPSKSCISCKEPAIRDFATCLKCKCRLHIRKSCTGPELNLRGVRRTFVCDSCELNKAKNERSRKIEEVIDDVIRTCKDEPEPEQEEEENQVENDVIEKEPTPTVEESSFTSVVSHRDENVPPAASEKTTTTLAPYAYKYDDTAATTSYPVANHNHVNSPASHLIQDVFVDVVEDYDHLQAEMDEDDAPENSYEKRYADMEALLHQKMAEVDSLYKELKEKNNKIERTEMDLTFRPEKNGTLTVELARVKKEWDDTNFKLREAEMDLAHAGNFSCRTCSVKKSLIDELEKSLERRDNQLQHALMELAKFEKKPFS
ncbi:unnamed protein product [Caenorhabditis auriculariae]|uniref:Uncharacterized protein n=1 Tax=Caenorhabditis auriculariae TaxID=2777116 RepID=A0A8S1HSE6_9PELO|nr:unnamed protein product [Caenorhabditis auriculariae]